MDLEKEYHYRKLILQLKESLEEQDKIASFYKNQFEQVINSKSWKMTEPIRKLTSKKQTKEVSEEKEYYELDPIDIKKEENVSFKGLKTDIKAFAFYETDRQNIDIDLQNKNVNEIVKEDATIAKNHGLSGFVFTISSLSEKTIINAFFENKELDISYCFYFQDDALKNVNKYFNYLKDPRYVKIENKPVILFDFENVDNVQKFCFSLRNKAKISGFNDLIILSKSNLVNKVNPNIDFIDGEFDYDYDISNISRQLKLIPSYCVNYSSLVKMYHDTLFSHFPIKSFSYTACLGLDEGSEKVIRYKLYDHFNLQAFYHLLTSIMWKIKNDDVGYPFLFVRSWNDYNRKMVLKPTLESGYALLNTFSRAIYSIPLYSPFKVLNSNRELSIQYPSILVQCHVYYVDLFKEILDELKKMPYSYNLLISTDTIEKQKEINDILKKENMVGKVEVFENKGRDVLPFFLQTKDCLMNYDYILHLHTKKTLQNPLYGDHWRRHLLYNLLGSKENITDILYEFSNNKKLGLIYPKPSSWMFSFLVNGNIGGNEDLLLQLFKRLNISSSKLNEDISFPMGTMFWARTNVIKPLFDKIKESDFPKEDKQYDATMLHAIERIWCLLANENGYSYLEIVNNHKETS